MSDIFSNSSGGVGLRLATRTLLSTTTLVKEDHTVLCNATSAAFTVYTPANAEKGQVFRIRKTDTSAYAVTVKYGSTTIATLSYAGSSVFIQRTTSTGGWTVFDATGTLLSVYGAGTAYSLTDTAAALALGTTAPTKVITIAGNYLLLATVHLTYKGATVGAETVTLKLRRTNNTAADVSNSSVTIDLPASTTLTHSYGIVNLPPVIYSTANSDDSVSIFGAVSAALGAGTIDVTAGGTSLVALRLGA